jgi:L-seryl-tRNA(Ser) seleniumtransferase
VAQLWDKKRGLSNNVNCELRIASCQLKTTKGRMAMAKGRGRISRRRLLRAGAALGAVYAGPGIIEAQAPSPANGRGRSVYEALGVKHVINATGTVTNLGGSLMPPEVVAAWVDASRHFVNLLELQNKVGERIAQLIGVEAALVTTGAAAALLLGTAAAVTGGDPKLIRRLPDTAGMKNEVILQKSHHSCYDNQLTNVGVRLVEVETAAEVAKAVNSRTALMFFMNKEDTSDPWPRGGEGRVRGIRRREWLELARRHHVPTLLDAAADVPPPDRLAGYNRMGFDLVAFSGGKAMRGPNDTGLLLGKRALIEAAKLNTNPHCPSIGRGMKVSKEDMIACLAAVERFVNLDHRAEWREWERRIGVIEAAVTDISGVQCERIVPPIANEVPHLIVAWDEGRVRLTRARATQQLAEGDPPIQIGRVSGTGDRGILISILTLQTGEERVVAERLRNILRRVGPNP